MIVEFDGEKPKLEGVYLAPGSQIIGNVSIKKGSSIWPNTIVRGDIAPIKIGFKCNIQDNSTLHVDPGFPLIMGDYVTVGHGAVIHSSLVEDDCLIGMGAIILSKTRIGKGSIIGAGAVVTEGTEIPPRSLVVGVPGKVIKELPREKINENREHAEQYFQLAKKYS